MTKRRKIITVILAIMCFLVAALAAVVLLAPRILSSDSVKSRMLARINSAPGVNLQIDRLALRWFAESRIEGIVFENDAGIKAEVESIVVPRGLKPFAGRRIDFGEITISRPQLTVSVLEAPLQDAAPAGKPVAGRKPVAGEKAEKPAPAVAKAKARPAADAAVKLPVDLKGSVKVRNASVMVVRGSSTERVLENIEIEIAFKWLENPVAVQFSATQGSGSINAALSIGGFPERTIEPDKIKSSVLLKLDKLELGPLTRMAGAIQAMPEIDGMLSADVRATAEGVSKAELNASVKGQDILVKTSGKFRPKPLALLEMRTDLAVNGKSVEIEAATIESSAGRIAASGSLVDQGGSMPAGRITANADINIAMLAQIIPEILKVREDLEFTGGALTANATIDSDGISMAVSGKAELKGLSGVSAGRPGTLAKPVSATFSAQLSGKDVILNELKVDSSFAGISAAGDMSAMTAAFSADIAAGIAELGKFLSIKKADAAGQLNGKLWASKLQDREAWQVGLQMNGQGVTTAGKPGHKLSLGSLKSSAALVFHKDLEGGRKGITDFTADINAAPLSANIVLPRLVLPDGGQAYPEIGACRISADTDLRKLASMLSGAGYIPAGRNIGGTVTVNANAALKSGSAQLEMQAAGKAVEFASGAFAAKEPEVKLSLKASHSLGEDAMAIEKLDLESATLSAVLSGRIAAVKTDKDADIEGVYTCDYARLGEILSAATAKDIRMAGKREEKIHVKGKLGLSDKNALLAGIIASAGVSLEKLGLFGMEMRDTKFSVNVGQGVASAMIKTECNDGKVELNPRVAIAGSAMALGLPDDARVLQGVGLTDEMVNEILARVHPLLRNCAAAGGRIDMTIARCNVPLDESALKAMTMSGRLDLHDVVLTPEGLIKQLLELARLEQRSVVLENESISFEVKDGRVETSPLKLGGGSSVITIAGSVGLDGKLNYSADTPVTEKMVGAEVFPYLKGASIKVPIRGTAMKPEISVAEFNQALASLVSEAGKKVIKEKGAEEIDKLIKEKGGKLLDGLLKKQQ